MIFIRNEFDIGAATALYILQSSPECAHSPPTAAVRCSTYTAPSARGKGVAGKLADAAFTFAREHGYAVRPTCSYIADAYIPGGKGAAASFAMDAGSGLALPKSA